ncbi:branched-chain amino acid transport protein [Streptococcus pneumoniae]|nr:branched-chain amino acid transport protein [Streptococcus pneumoniae]
MVSKYLLLAVLFSGLVTWIPRMIPFILVKYKGLPAIVERFLKFLPVSIIFALILSSVVTGKVGSLPQIKWLDFLAVFPTAWIAFRYRNLVGTVLFGVVLIAILRLVFHTLRKSLQTTSASPCLCIVTELVSFIYNLKTVF